MLFSAAAQPSVQVAPADAVGPRALEKPTQSAVIRDYLRAWETLGRAMGQNRADLLETYFVGTAKDQLSNTIRQQQTLGIEASYRDQSHDIHIVFYSPEGLSIQLVDNVEFEIELRDNQRVVGSQRIQARYVAVVTPTESKWKIRVLQSAPGQPAVAESTKTSNRNRP